MGVLFMKGRERMWKNECVSIDLFIHVIFCLLINFKKNVSHIILVHPCQVVMYGLLYECKFLTIEETNKKKWSETW